MAHPDRQQRAYLDAMGIDVWIPRDTPLDTPAEAVVAEATSSEAVAASGLGWDELRQCVAECRRCELAATRTQTVFGVGNPAADLMIIGEAPGAEEDRRGEPFVGRAGQLLDEMLRAVGFDRSTVFIANILKCRPPNNRDPKAEEAAACRDYLNQQLALVSPRLVIAVGRIAAQTLLQSDDPVGRMRGQRHDINGTPLIVTYHPAYLLRSPGQKRKSWADLSLAMRVMAESAA